MDKVSDRSKKIVITGGGSGGHSVTAISVIDEWKKRNPEITDRMIYIGSKVTMVGEKGKKSVEEKLLDKRDIKFVKIRGGKLQRRFSLSTIKLLFGVFGGLIDAWKFFKKHDVGLVFSSGGYVTVPVCFVAWIKKIPIVIHEQTTRVGLTNRICSKFAHSILVGYKDAIQFFPESKTNFVGNTVRECIIEPPQKHAPLQGKIDSFRQNRKKYPVIFFMNGGQASHLINKTLMGCMKRLLMNYQLIVITGDNQVTRDYERMTDKVSHFPRDLQKRVILTPFARDEIGLFYELADLFVGRGGALSIYELGVTQTPALIVPIPWVTQNEQYHNAKVLEDLGLVTIIPQGVLSPEVLAQKINLMVEKIKDDRLNVHKTQLEQIFVKDGAQKIVDVLMRILSV